MMRGLSRPLACLLVTNLLLGSTASLLRADDYDLTFAGEPIYYDAVFGQGTIHSYDPYGDSTPVEEIPVATTGAETPTAAKPQNPVHTVVRGDTLWGLASRYCGSGPDWRSIYEANRDKIKDPHWIYPGQQFVIACPGGAAPSTAKPDSAPAGKPATDAGKGGNGGNSAITTVPLPPGSYRVSSEFGPRNAPKTATGYGSTDHKGIDLGAPSGTTIRAAGEGTVEVAGWQGGYGYVVYIRHPNGWVTRYGHMRSRPSVRPGQRVSAGQKIGEVGSTGNSSGPHLHFETRKPDGTAVNPRGMLNF